MIYLYLSLRSVSHLNVNLYAMSPSISISLTMPPTMHLKSSWAVWILPLDLIAQRALV